jgi:hypothetical protein
MVHLMTYDELRAALMSYLFISETYCACENCDTGNDAEYVVITNGGETRICEACHND